MFAGCARAMLRGGWEKGARVAERILMVDDEREIGDLVRVYLENEGFIVEVFVDGARALARIEDAAAPPVRLGAPRCDAARCRRLRASAAKIREHHTYPVIMLTANGRGGRPRHGAHAGRPTITL